MPKSEPNLRGTREASSRVIAAVVAATLVVGIAVAGVDAGVALC